MTRNWHPLSKDIEDPETSGFMGDATAVYQFRYILFLFYESIRAEIRCALEGRYISPMNIYMLW